MRARLPIELTAEILTQRKNKLDRRARIGQYVDPEVFAGMREVLSFILNGRLQALREVDPATTLLNYLRKTCRLTGTKEGCAEGDCGACTVVVAERIDGGMRYRAVNACIALLPTLEGRSVITVEHLQNEDGGPHPVQQALVDCHGSQCGFCTPGFVMSLYAAYLSRPKPDGAQLNDVLAGNLCRCTGYGPIVTAGLRMHDYPRPIEDSERRKRDAEQLASVAHDETVAVERDGRRFFSPATIDELARLCLAYPDARLVAGATDLALWTTKLNRDLGSLISIHRIHALRVVSRKGDDLSIGAGATWTDLIEVIGNHYPDFGELLRRFGAVQVRNAATIGGNIANGSPIGDAAPALIALGARLILRRGASRRTIPLESFFVAYGKQDRQPGEFLEAIEMPLLDDPERLKCYKVSKRFDQDISAVCGCFNIDTTGGTVREVRICFGGMAGTAKRASHLEAALTHRPWTLETVTAALPAFDRDYAPISDMRGSAAYRIQVARNLLLKCFHETQGPPRRTRLVGREGAFA
jgi:xanthine dehydrogenase small subunit